MKFKITPLTIIIFLLLILVLLIVLNNSSFFSREGFVSFLQNEDPATLNIIPQYGKDKIHKLYDNLFFDNRNGNLIEVNSPTYVDSGDISGETISEITITPRNSNVSFTYNISSIEQRVEEPSKKLLTSNNTFVYESKSENTDKYVVFYMPWDKKTFLHVLKLTNDTATNESSYYFNDTSISHSKMLNSSNLAITDFQVDDSENNNTDVLEPLYNTTRKLHQISKYTLFDKKNGNIIIKTDDNNFIEIYKRGSNDKIIATAPEQEEEDGENETMTTFGDDDEFKPVDYVVNMHIVSSSGDTLLAMSYGVDTILALIGKNATGDITIKKLKHISPKQDKKSDEADESKNDEADESKNDEAGESKNDVENADFNMHDYILKTQIVPPVCPSCPSCPSCPKDVTCNNCGGGGGSGTLSKDGNSNVVGDAISKTTDLVGDTTKSAVGAVGDVAGGAVGAVGDVAGGAVGAVGDVAGGAVGAVGDVAGGAVGAAGGVVSSAIGAVGDVASSAIGAVGKLGQSGQSNNQALSMNQHNGSMSPPSMHQSNGVSNATDPYSYNGQLLNRKSTNYMPITADFSSFGK